jgi:epsilon-lactone hydrolase
MHPNRPAAQLCLLLFTVTVGSGQTLPVRTVPARAIPAPITISPEMQRRSAAVWHGNTDAVTKTSEQWKNWIREMDVYKFNEAVSLEKQFHVTLEEKRIGGVHVYLVKPEHIPEPNQKRLLVHVHGGGYIFFGGMAATTEAILMAYYTGTEVISIDYRMPPDYPFPAAIDDSVAVWKEVIQSYPPSKVGLFGSSAGGGLTLAVVIRLKELGLPLPGALMAGNALGRPDQDWRHFLHQ